ncbi:MAG: hypothetical protein RL097_659 [Candidatus Parcubacteria bacterium]|jgi:hypothetical protein
MNNNISDPVPETPNATNRKRFIILGSVVLFALFILLLNSNGNEFRPIQNEYTATYKSSHLPNNNHYRFEGADVHWYSFAGGGFGWNKQKLEGVKTSAFEPISKDYAIVHTESGRILYNGSQPVEELEPGEVDNIKTFSPINTNPRYFQAGRRLFYGGITERRANLISNIGPTDKIIMPDSFHRRYNTPDEYCENSREYKDQILFVNNDVFFNGKRIPDADSGTFKQISPVDPANIGPWFADKNRVYFYGHPVKFADPGTFIVAEKISTPNNPGDCVNIGSVSMLGYDNNRIYHLSLPAWGTSKLCENDKLCEIDMTVYTAPFDGALPNIPPEYDLKRPLDQYIIKAKLPI